MADQPIRRRRPLGWWLALASLPLAVMYTAYAIEHQAPPEERDTTTMLSEVTVLQIRPDNYSAKIEAFGEVKPRYALQLQAEISGRIERVAPVLETGRRLQKGSELLSIDSTNYRQGLASAELQLSQAQLQWATEQQEAERAKEDWLRSGLGKLADAPPLLLRSPQLKAAKAKVREAKAQLALARRDLENATVLSPFDAVVVERHVVPGQYVRTGDVLAQLYSVDRADVRITLPESQWDLLPAVDVLRAEGSKGAEGSVILQGASGARWHAVVSEVDQHVDQRNRQRSMLLSVDEPLAQATPLLAGTFVSVALTGREQSSLLRVPAASLGGDGRLWFVGEKQQLASFTADIVFQHDGWLFVRTPAKLLSQMQERGVQIVTSPLSSYVDGQQVIVSVTDVSAG